MTTPYSSSLAFTGPPSYRDIRKESLLQISRDETLDDIQALILELSTKISRDVLLLDPAEICDDLDALRWIQLSLDDVEATLIGLLEASRRSAASRNRASSSAGSLVLLANRV